MLISALENCEFILTIYTLKHILSVTLPISKCLQEKEKNFINASNYIQSIVNNLTNKLSNCEHYFNKIYMMKHQNS